MIVKLQWIPNLFTLGNLSLGFFAIVLSSSELAFALQLAGGLIFLAALCDGLDGYAARLLNAKSELGAQLDSLADLTTFGIAPATLMYGMILHNWKFFVEASNHSIPVGLLIAVIWPATTAFRLARFNVSHSEGGFTGLPSPVAGLIVALMPVVMETAPLPEWILVLIYVVVAFLMVSTVKYSKPQVTLFRKFSPVRMSLLVFFFVFALAFVTYRFGVGYAAAGMMMLMVIYIVLGIVSFLIHAIQELKM